jgi:glutamate-1-semialdehyde 2,1-aminomutase
MNEFLRALDSDEIRATYSDLDARWAARARRLNSALEAEELPVSIAGLVSVWTTLYSRPGRFHWMLQFYLRDAGLLPSWIGSGRYIFSHSLSDEDFEEITARFVKAARAMEEDGWWWSSPELTGAAVQRSLRREILAAFFGRRSESRPTPLDGRQADAV